MTKFSTVAFAAILSTATPAFAAGDETYDAIDNVMEQTCTRLAVIDDASNCMEDWQRFLLMAGAAKIGMFTAEALASVDNKRAQEFGRDAVAMAERLKTEAPVRIKFYQSRPQKK